ncbi:translation initiation factor IF-2 N-terminal domain-containing protein [Blautia faecis]|mgnify:FL=1|uniref:translation initiation factor IF-2 N-terminal domain-containing protein n=1 Tax=Blautia faecis TaxID=871665 RepID=UPI0028A4EFBC|nr:translation initiation factor IF-2 N-terminal domain-containing protein [Blautia faecis]MDT4368425.1 translation initiation factor IF-2 N-terminal domain-containing protein [Blautia faecis]
MKVFELAKEIGVPSSDVVALLKENEVPVKNHMTPLSDEAIEMVRANYITVPDEPEKVEVKEPKKVVKTDADYRPEEMIPCRSLFAGVLLFTGDHTHMTYAFNGAGDRRNIEYQDLKAAMLQHKGSIFDPDIIIEDENLINDEHWFEVKEVYENMFNEKDIEKVMNLPYRDFEKAFIQLPITAKNRIITTYATQMENGTFEQWNKAKIIDKVCGTRFDLKM